MATAAEYAGGEALPGIAIGATVRVTTDDRDGDGFLKLDGTFLGASPYGIGLGAPRGGVLFLPWASVASMGIIPEGDDDGTA